MIVSLKQSHHMISLMLRLIIILFTLSGMMAVHADAQTETTPAPTQSLPVKSLLSVLAQPIAFSWQEIWRDHRPVMVVLGVSVLFTLIVLLLLVAGLFRLKRANRKIRLISNNLEAEREQLNSLLLEASRMKEQEEIYQVMVTMAADSMTLFDPETYQFVEFNNAACQELGYNRTEFAALTVLDIQAEFNATQLAALFCEVQTNGSAQFESIHRHKFGILTYVSVSLQAVRLHEHDYFVALWRDITKRKIMDNRLKRNEDLLNRAQSIGKVGSWSIELVGNGIEWSAETYRMFGVSPEQAINIDFFISLVHPDDQDSVKKAWQQALLGAPYDIEHRIVVNNQIVWVHERAKLLFTKNGMAVSGIGTVQDITEQKLTADQLYQESSRLQDIIDAIHAGTWEWNLVTGEVLFNERWAEMFGYKKEELEPFTFDTWNKFIHPDDLEQTNTLLIAHLAGDTKYYECELRMRHKQGHWIWVSDRGRLKSTTDDGKPLLMSGIHLDITEKKQAQLDLENYRNHLEELVLERTTALELAHQKINLSEQRFAHAVNVSSDGIWDWDLTTGQAYFSPPYFTMLGYQADEFPQTVDSWISLLHPDDKDRAIASKQEQLIATGVSDVEFRMRTKAGEYHWILSKGKIVDRDNQARPIRAIGTHTDITLRKQTELALRDAKEAAETANQAKSIFLANMSHEIRTPMNAILGLTYLIQRELTDSHQRQQLDKVTVSARHLLGIINDILDLSKIEANRLTLEMIDFNVAARIDYVCSMLNERLNEKDLQIKAEIDKELFTLVFVGDALRIDQILLNFISNAIKFTEQGTIVIRAKQVSEADETNLLRFEVQDTGIGLSEDQQSRIFDAFEQAQSSTTRKYGGTGLGLTICKRLVELMDGNIGVISQPNVGSTFWFSLPLQRGINKPFAETSKFIDHFKPNAYLLLAEDNEINQEVARELLESVGIQVDVANNGQEAVKMFIKNPVYDLVLMDMQMPIMDGMEATRIIRTLARGQSVPIIAMTANVFTEDRQRCLEAGMNDHIAKPVDPEKLYTLLNSWIPDTINLQPEASEVKCASVTTDSPNTKTIESTIPLLCSPLLDMPKGVHYFGGKQKHYFKMLIKFTKTHRHDAQTLHDLLAAGKIHDVVRIAHSLKGLCATLGAETVKSLAETLEYQLHQTTDLTEIDDLLSQLDQELHALCQFINALNLAPEVPDIETMAPEVINASLLRLEALLAEDDLQSADVWQTLAPALREHLGTGNIDRLTKQIENFDFPAALDSLRALIKDNSE